MVAFRQLHRLTAAFKNSRSAALAAAAASLLVFPPLASGLAIGSSGQTPSTARHSTARHSTARRRSHRDRCGRRAHRRHTRRRATRIGRLACRRAARHRLAGKRPLSHVSRGSGDPKKTVPSTTTTTTTTPATSIVTTAPTSTAPTSTAPTSTAPTSTAPTSTAPTSTAPPTGPSWNGDFSTGNWSQYSGSPAYHPDGNPADYAIVNSPTPLGFAHAFQATLESGTGSVVAGQAGERTLLTLWPSSDDGVSGHTRAYQGADTWYRDEIYFPTGFVPSQDTTWNWLYELHNFPDGPCCANLALSVVTDGSDGGPSGGERLSVRIMGGGSPANPIDSGSQTAYSNPDAVISWIEGPQLQTGRWYDLVWHVHWDWRPTSLGGQGRAEYWIDGAEIGSYTGPTLFYYRALNGPGQAYLQDGYYRPDDTAAGYAQPTVSVYHGATMIGPTASSIGEPMLG
jgi:hypothetical protein